MVNVLRFLLPEPDEDGEDIVYLIRLDISDGTGSRERFWVWQHAQMLKPNKQDS